MYVYCRPLNCDLFGKVRKILIKLLLSWNCSDIVLVQDDDQLPRDQPPRDQPPRAPIRSHANAQQKKLTLGDQPECEADVHKLCGKLTNNFAIIDCLQSDNLASIIELFASSLLLV